MSEHDPSCMMLWSVLIQLLFRDFFFFFLGENLSKGDIGFFLKGNILSQIPFLNKIIRRKTFPLGFSSLLNHNGLTQLLLLCLLPTY
jgi:hypothetical protein